MQEERRMTQEELLEEARETAIENAKEYFVFYLRSWMSLAICFSLLYLRHEARETAIEDAKDFFFLLTC